MNTNTSLQHHGIKGQKWGVRRFQNADGSRTAAGEKRYSSKLAKTEKHYKNKIARGSLHSINAFALDNAGYRKAADRELKKADMKNAKWKAKANKAAKTKKLFDAYMKDLDNFEKQGKGNDIDLIIKRSKIYDQDIATVRKEYKEEIKRAKKYISSGESLKEYAR